MRSRRSSRDSRPSNCNEDGDESENPPPPLEEEEERSGGSIACAVREKGSLSPGDSVSRKGSLIGGGKEVERGGWSEKSGNPPSIVPSIPASAKEAAGWTTENKEKMEDSRNSARRGKIRSSWVCSLGTMLVAFTSAFVLWNIIISFRDRQCDAKGCRMSRMSPVYLKANDFDTEHTRFASKYDLYLYREHGVDDDYPVCRD